ncbi:SRPBCC family protein [Halomonas campisalis]|uniref:SRPBCC family protein n=1 Tax=Billgrantia campisalis TaxID=74661 RepID=A0ABS9P6L4_9GAMM|nr:SRPBCC family protein [Halomonas campisalis]MCG6656760.1 SRPBCC family protein [Halomonas campisalis]MDR5861949.1 SRPBCC family protein [Halomonas campisalis]
MEIEKSLTLDAPPQQVWELVLDPQAMCGCVPGMQSVEVISDDEYVAHMQVKISFITARFTLNTRIVEQEAPRYLRAEGTGEDASVASSLTQTSEMFLNEREDGGTDLRIKVKADVFGRLGTFGLAVMKTKADRMWDEFGTNLIARLNGEAPEAAETPRAAATAEPTPTRHPAPSTPANTVAPRAGWLARLLGRAPAQPSAEHIHVEVERGTTRIRIDWPAQQSDACAAWLRELVKA